MTIGKIYVHASKGRKICLSYPVGNSCKAQMLDCQTVGIPECVMVLLGCQVEHSGTLGTLMARGIGNTIAFRNNTRRVQKDQPHGSPALDFAYHDSPVAINFADVIQGDTITGEKASVYNNDPFVDDMGEGKPAEEFSEEIHHCAVVLVLHLHHNAV